MELFEVVQQVSLSYSIYIPVSSHISEVWGAAVFSFQRGGRWSEEKDEASNLKSGSQKSEIGRLG